MLVIRPEQFEQLTDYIQTPLASRYCDLFIRIYPRESREAGGRAGMLRWVRSGLRSAVEAGCATEYECGRWLGLMMMLGVDFAVDPQLPWAQQALGPFPMRGGGFRLDGLFKQALDYLEDTAGEDASNVRRAALRIQKYDFAALPALEGDAAVADACERIGALYPEKFRVQGADLTARTVADNMRRARAFGHIGSPAEFQFALLAFMLGSGFHHDLLHPWAVSILHPEPGRPDDPATLVQRLAACVNHIAASLSEG